MNGKVFDNDDELEAATLVAAAAGWKAAAGRDMTPRDRANFEDRGLPVDEQVAADLAETLFEALTRAADFDRAHRRSHQTPPGDNARQLLFFIKRHLPFLIDAERSMGTVELAAANGQVDVDVAGLKRMYDRPSLVAALPRPDRGWDGTSINNRVVALLGEKSETGYWRMFGLTEPPTAKTMAYAAILLGHYPSFVPKPAKVSDVIEMAAKAIRAARARK
jgi:hypothetical protein